MALKGSRRIVVAGKKFNWIFTGHSEGFEASPRRGKLIIQEESGAPGKAMVAHLSATKYVSDEYHNVRLGGERFHATVAPKDVRLVLEAALADKWDASNKTVTYLAKPGIELQDYITVTQPK